MANMTEGFKNAILDYGATLITHIALVNESGTEIDGGSYARLTVTWSSASGASIQPTEDLIFEVPGGVMGAGDLGDLEVRLYDTDTWDIIWSKTMSINGLPNVDYAKWYLWNNTIGDHVFVNHSEYPVLRINAHRMILKTNKLMLYPDMNARLVNPEKFA